MPANNPLILKLTQSGLLTEEDHAVLTEVTRDVRHVPAETVLVEQGAPVEGAPLVVSGIAYRYRLLQDGRRQILGMLLPGDFCDLQGALLGSSDHYTEALTDAETVWLTRETIDRLTLAPTRIARALWWSTLVDEAILRAWLTNMGQQEANKWLAHFICEFLLRLQVVGRAQADAFEMPFRQAKLADILGITSVHVSRTLSDLRDRGLLDLSHRRVKIPDVARLRAYCEFDPSYLHLKRPDMLPSTAT